MGPPEQRIGQLLGGKYRLEELLALGGMGLVYGARHEATGRSLAVKVLRPELAGRPDWVRRVSAEARLAVEASHPNVVEVLDAGTDALDVPYLVLERLYGQPLDALLDEALPLLTSAQALVPVLNALTTLHRLGIVHRDLKPSNIFLSDDGSGRVTPKLLDFGIAKALEGGGPTLSGTAFGTPAYMAPEQALGCNSSAPAIDIWSMGVVFVRCLTGHLPFESIETHGFGSLRSGLQVSDLEGVPEPLARVLVRALQLEPRERPATMLEFRNALLVALREVDAKQPWPNEMSVSFAPAESALAAALARRTRGRAVGAEPAGAKARVLVRHAPTLTLAKVGSMWHGGGFGARALRPSLGLLAAAAAVVSLASWLDRGSAPSPAAPAPSPQLDVPRHVEVATSQEALARGPASGGSSSMEQAARALPVAPNVSPALRLEARAGAPSPPVSRAPAPGAEQGATAPPVPPEVPAEPSPLASSAPRRIGANRSPIIE